MKAEEVLDKFFVQENKENIGFHNIHSDVKDTKKKSNGCHFTCDNNL